MQAACNRLNRIKTAEKNAAEAHFWLLRHFGILRRLNRLVLQVLTCKIIWGHISCKKKDRMKIVIPFAVFSKHSLYFGGLSC